MNWSALPFVRLVLPLSIGIALGTLPVLATLFTPFIISSTFSFFLLFALKHKRLGHKYRRWFGVILFMSVAQLGFLLAFSHTSRNHPLHLSQHLENSLFWQFKIERLKPNTESIRLEGSVLKIVDTNKLIQTVEGKLLFYLNADSIAQTLAVGDVLLVASEITDLEAPKNPKAFDFAAHMAKKGIYHRAFAKSGNWQKISSHPTFYGNLLYPLQQYGLRVLSEHLPNENEFSIAAALIMGQRSFVNETIKEAYTSTGAIHVLAVSGLHVGIIYLGLGWVLNFIGWKGQTKRILRSLILLIAIWSFALFTGGSASILRAASMFSFIIVGEAIHRRQNIYNTLAASAFILLCIFPYLLLDIGFQLSYLAVIGIIFFHGRIYRTWYIAQPLGNYLWKLASVSIAAQLTTLPISLFYFHQFPIYFWLSGWVVVPAAMLILGIGVFLLFFSKIHLLAAVLGNTLSWMIGLMNWFIFEIQQLPGGLITGVWLGISTVLLIFITLGLVMFGLQQKRLRPIQWSLLCLILISGYHHWKLWQAEEQQLLSIYHVRHHSTIDFFDGRNGVCLSDLPASDPQLQMATKNFRDYAQIRTLVQYSFRDSILLKGSFYRHNNFLQIDQLKIAIIDQLPKHPPPQPMNLDYLLIRKNPTLTIADLKPYFNFKMVVFDASNSSRNRRKWAEYCLENQLPYHDIVKQGAFVLNLKHLDHLK